jgi:hypothetical protein
MSRKTIFPTDMRDWLSLISLFGFLAIFLKFTFGKEFLSNAMEAIFLIFAGSGFMVLGKVFTIKRWVGDGLQQREYLQVTAIIFGLSSMIIGFMLLFKQTIPVSLYGVVGILALIPLSFILIDYWKKNY